MRIRARESGNVDFHLESDARDVAACPNENPIVLKWNRRIGRK